MPCAAHHDLFVGLSFDLDDFIARLEGRPAIRCTVLPGVGRIDLLQVEILHVRADVGEAPRDSGSAAQDDARQPGQGCADHVQRLAAGGCGGLQSREVPDGWSGQPQMRIVGEQGLAALGVAAGNHPVVRSLAARVAQAASPVVDLRCIHQGKAAGRWRCFRQRARPHGRIPIAVHTQAAVKRGQVDGGGGRLPWIRRHQLPQGLGVDALQCRQPGELIAPVAAQVERHHQRPTHGVLRCPGAGPGAEDVKFRRQGLAPIRMKAVDAVRIRLDDGLRVVGQPLPLRLRRLHDAERAQQLVGLQRGGAEHFAQFAMHHAPVEFELPAALLRMHPAQRE